jgi:cyclopropane fatty-acyl-phospholipid synthase-like methyltransferase
VNISAGDPSNAQTLASYDATPQQYVERTSEHLSPAAQQWLEAALRRVPPGSTILEIGSGTGRDAAWLEAQGFTVIRTEASTGLREYLRSQGYEVRPLNVLTDEVDEQYAMIHANAVPLHLTPDQLSQVLRRIHAWLAPEGVFTCSVKQGHGERWETEKLDQPRFFHYWSAQDFTNHLQACGFHVEYLDAETPPAGGDCWIMAIAGRAEQPSASEPPR